MAVHHPHEEVLLAVAYISERLCLLAKNKRSTFERVSMVICGYTGCWISLNGVSVVCAPGSGEEAHSEASLPPLADGVLHLLNLNTTRTGSGEEGEHNKLLLNSSFGKC